MKGRPVHAAQKKYNSAAKAEAEREAPPRRRRPSKKNGIMGDKRKYRCTRDAPTMSNALTGSGEDLMTCREAMESPGKEIR